ncbi:DNA sulfur modification protein DndE [Plesiomonas shigelloides]|uniref:DNA sulfur modification protein DndE n=1 Tax=Plesiomonas shigelloides TaxID=703 RepID=UPI0012622A49|nr:DNA sulfur modification protein DndE [Plesiomonas shigelloides]KAB7689973.1 DNA sulfur modification protein DndE [Plesiomonas shigelloides]MDO4687459.1 DNA sulfur modification protein DndE [Plesiomonas sp.]
MLPNRMQLNKQTEEQLKRLKAYTGITPNVAARLAFFRSVESGFRYHKNNKKLDGNLTLDKITWLGETLFVTELTLQMIYPDLDRKEWINAWAAHVEDGASAIRNRKTLNELAQAL